MSLSKSLPALTSAMEDYLEAIYHLEQERRIARVRDIANRLSVKMSSVSSALKTLDARGLIGTILTSTLPSRNAVLKKPSK